LKQIPVALLSDQLQRNRGSTGLRPYHQPAPLAGTAVTVRTRAGDNLAILRAFDICRPGDVLVIDADGDIANALVGGIMTFYAASIGVAGMVIDGAIRDVAEIRERPFPVYARGVNHRGPYKDGPGAINVPVSAGGMAVCPGDLVVGDQDGLIVLSREEAPAVIEKALLQKQKEEATMQAIREGRWDRSFVDSLEARSINV
jgi:regulator of RNase E activity RraA